MIYDNQRFEFSFKFHFLYPSAAVVLLFLLNLLVFQALDIEPGFPGYILIFIFYFVSAVRTVLSRQLEIPRLIQAVEIAAFCGLSLVLIPDLNRVAFYFLWVVCILSWFNIEGLSNKVLDIKVNTEEIRSYNSREHDWRIEEKKKGITYKKSWGHILGHLPVYNAILFLCWLIQGELEWSFFWLSIFFAVIQLFFAGSLFFEKKTIDWSLEGMEVEKRIRGNWFKIIVVLVIFITVFAAVLPRNYSPVTYRGIIGLVQQFEIPAPAEMGPMMGVSEEEAELGGEDREETEPGPLARLYVVAGEIIFFVIGAGVTLFLLAFLLTFISDEFERMLIFPRFFRFCFRYIKKVIALIVSGFKRIPGRFRRNKTQVESRKEQAERKLDTRKIKERDLSRDSGSVIVSIYLLLVKLLEQKGLRKSPEQTPYEFSKQVEEEEPDIGEEVRSITDVYVELIYSDHGIGKKARRVVHEVWERVQGRL
ncbi:MAG: DUF4129 domain-containing protein [Halanaerobiales bacterium]